MTIYRTKIYHQLPVKAVLFDLDDTLFDHRYSSRSGLAAVSQKYPCFQQRVLNELEQIHMQLLDELYPQVLQKALSREEARVERFRQLFLRYGETVSSTTAKEAESCYLQAYQFTRRPVSGVIPLLKELRPRVKIAVVTNNLVTVQRDKLQCCGLDPLIDALVVSEEVGATKPEAAIFKAALNRVMCRAEQAVMIGDSWSTDIIGARRVGIRAIWLNRYGIPCPDPASASEIDSFEPIDAVLELLFKKFS